MRATPATLEATTGEDSCQSLLWAEINRIFEDLPRNGESRVLEVAFEHLRDDKLVSALEQTNWTGRPPRYPAKVLWRTIVAKQMLGIETFAGLRRELDVEKNPFVARLCGIWSKDEIPKKWTYSRFLRKLIRFEGLVRECVARMVEALQAEIPGFGRVVAVDATPIHAWSNPRKKRGPRFDQDARRGVKGKEDEDKWFGYKAHLIADAVHELPIMVEVIPPTADPGIPHESPHLLPLLKRTKEAIPTLAPSHVLTDAGYDANENYKGIVEEVRAIPIIDLNLRGRKGKPPRFEDIADEEGTPYCAAMRPYTFWGYDRKQKALKYRCPLATGKQGCLWIEKCSGSPYGQVVKIKLSNDYRRFIQVPRHTKKWKALKKKRVAIERTFSRSKGFRTLEKPTVRGLDRVTLHCLTSILAMQAWALAMIKLGQPERIRSCVHG